MNKKVIGFSLLNALFIASFASIIACKVIKKGSAKKVKTIGVVVDYEVDETREERLRYLYDYQQLRNRYIENFEKICGKKNIAFVMIPISLPQVDKFADIVDGVVFTGGQDIDGKYFNQETHPKAGKDSIPRTEFELAFAKRIMAKKKPILGICRGMQMLNVVNGGDIIQDIPSEFKTEIDHLKFVPMQTNHLVNISNNSLLYGILKKKEFMVNSAHHQAVGKVAENLKTTATAPDGIIEAIEGKDSGYFLLGTQWHPEFLTTDEDAKIIEAFCDAVENA